MEELAKNPPSSIDELKSTVECLAESLDVSDVSKAVANVIKRAKVCKAEQGGTFNTFSRKLKLENMVIFNHFWKCSYVS